MVETGYEVVERVGRNTNRVGTVGAPHSDQTPKLHVGFFFDTLPVSCFAIGCSIWHFHRSSERLNAQAHSMLSVLVDAAQQLEMPTVLQAVPVTVPK